MYTLLDICLEMMTYRKQANIWLWKAASRKLNIPVFITSEQEDSRAQECTTDQCKGKR